MNDDVASRPDGGLELLYLCHRVPYPPDKGERIRAFHQVRSLAARHRVSLLSLTDGPVPDLGPLQELCKRVEVYPVDRRSGYLRSAGALFRPGEPLTLSFFDSPELRARLASLVADERFDAAIVYSSAMAPYLDAFPRLPAILDMVDVDSAKWAQYSRFAPWPLRPVYALEARRLRAYEAALARRFPRVVLATGGEVRQLHAFAPEARAVAVPNGVDLDFFRPFHLPKAEHPTLVFTGQMDYFANVDGVVHFARRIFPRLRRRFPNLEFLIVGRSPNGRVRALGDLPGVTVTGAVGDVRPFLTRAWVFVAPLRIAQGIQNKVLEAMASRLPVVCTERVHAGLAEGGFLHQRDLLAAADDREMERWTGALLEDAELRSSLARSAWQRLASVYRWEESMARFEDLLAEVTGRPSARSKEVRSPAEERIEERAEPPRAAREARSA